MCTVLLPPGDNPTAVNKYIISYHCTGGWVGLRAGLDRCGKSLPTPGFDPRTVHPVGSRYTDYAGVSLNNTLKDVLAFTPLSLNINFNFPLIYTCIFSHLHLYFPLTYTCIFLSPTPVFSSHLHLYFPLIYTCISQIFPSHHALLPRPTTFLPYPNSPTIY